MDSQGSHQQVFGHSPTVSVRAPGRINLIGEHIDYHFGLVLPAAVEQSIRITYSPSDGHLTRIYSANYDEWYVEGDAISEGSWKKYIKAIGEIAKREDLSIRPFNAFIHSDLPSGAGMSSSAALCCGLLTLLNMENQWELDRLEIGFFAQAVEHELGVMCGLMDQYAVLFGKQDQVILLDCMTNTHQYFSAVLGDFEIVLLHSGVNHALVDSAYNDRRSASENALEKLREQFAHVSTYRDVTPEMISRSSMLSEEQVQLADYIVDEIGRVKAAANCLANKKIDDLGVLIRESHRGLSKQYRVTCAETDFLVECCDSYPVISGSRQLGGGFGGCVLALIRRGESDTLAEIAKTYFDQFGIDLQTIPVSLSQGVVVTQL